MTTPDTTAGPAAAVLIALVTGYRRVLSPLLPPRCRFAPSCSSYALTALRRHGALRGSWLTVRRLARCHPFHPGGYDPVPADPVPADPVPADPVPGSALPDPRPFTRRSGATRA